MVVLYLLIIMKVNKIDRYLESMHTKERYVVVWKVSCAHFSVQFLGVRRSPMARIGQEGLNNFLTDHLSRYLLGCGVRSLGRR